MTALLFLCFLPISSPATQAAQQDWTALTDKLYQALRYDDWDTFQHFMKKADSNLVNDFHNLRFKPRGAFIGGNLFRAIVHCRANTIGYQVVAKLRTSVAEDRFVADYLNHIDDQDGLTFLGWLKMRAQSLNFDAPHDWEELRKDALVLQNFRVMGAKVECELDPEFPCTEEFDPWLFWIAEELKSRVK
ncbi:hypothetical protein [Acanthopleuribacter pedis]|uniref:Uncharacterized protein n=1 Tax=Acanthopleuribacter pedis TaxID=442870 RepID=A0A8J7QIP1_9BACT|nr:hypothetical protein [Acanthopleuribacter pedis]MBO1323100.1 hypothetical protein [Acanthopleuribacter pedis]